jgi:hypothetical protein
LAFALFIMVLVWALQRRLKARLPQLLCVGSDLASRRCTYLSSSYLPHT